LGEALDTSYEGQAIRSDDAQKIWEETVKDIVISAVAKRSVSRNGAPGYQNIHELDADEPTYETEEEDSTNRAWRLEHYVGELFIDRKASPAHTVHVYKDLKKILNSEIISVEHSATGTTFKCEGLNPEFLLGALGELGGVSSWSLVAV
jgi:hypothetical protein